MCDIYIVCKSFLCIKTYNNQNKNSYIKYTSAVNVPDGTQKVLLFGQV